MLAYDVLYRSVPPSYSVSCYNDIHAISIVIYCSRLTVKLLCSKYLARQLHAGSLIRRSDMTKSVGSNHHCDRLYGGMYLILLESALFLNSNEELLP